MRLTSLKRRKVADAQGGSATTDQRRKSRMIRNIFIALLTILAIFVTWRVVLICRYHFRGPVIYIHGLVSATELFMSAKVDGTIIELSFEERDFVRKGETIVQLDNEEYLAKTDEAEADLEVALRENEVMVNEAARELENAGKLHETGAMTPQNLALLQAKYELIIARSKASELKAKAALRRARAKLKETTMLAPSAGVVSWRLKQVGEVVRAGDDILVLMDPSKVWLSAQIPQSKIGLVQIGQKTRATMNAFPGKEYYGHIERIFPRLRTVKGKWWKGVGAEEKVLDAKIAFDESYPELRPGLVSRIVIYLKEAEGISDGETHAQAVSK